MKYLIPAIFLILGLFIGYLVGKNSVQKNIQQANVTQPTTTNTTLFIHDTIVKKEIIKITPPSTDTLFTDTLQKDTTTNTLLDTTVAEYAIKNKDTLSSDTAIIKDETININSDKKITSKIISINYLTPTNTSTSDSLINKLINVNPVKPQQIIIEFWESPLNYTGYKMSKSKLIVYGLNPHFDYQLYAKNDQYFLNFEQIYYQLQETTNFKKYVSVDKSIIFND